MRKKDRRSSDSLSEQSGDRRSLSVVDQASPRAADDLSGARADSAASGERAQRRGELLESTL